MSYTVSLRIPLRVVLGTLFLSMGYGWLQAQTPFDVTVSAAGPNFAHIQDIQPPANAGTNRKTIARMITLDSGGAGADVNAITFQVVPQAAANMSTGGPITIGTNLTSVVTQNGTGSAVADVIKATKVASSNGYAVLELEIDYTDNFDFGGAPPTWDLQAQKQSADREYSGFWVTATGSAATVSAMVQKAKVQAIANFDFGSIQINLPTNWAPQRMFTIRNLGTGVLNLANPPLALPAGYSLVGVIVLTPLDIGASAGIGVQFLPTTLGLDSGTVSVNSNEPNPKTSFTLQGTGVTLDAILLFDVSNSMNWLPNGDPAPDEAHARLGQAKQAGLQLFQEYHGLTGGLLSQANFGLYTFPDPDVLAQVPSSRIAVNIGPVGVVDVGGALSRPAPEGLKANGWTPMAEGIKRAQADLPNGTVNTNDRPFILLMTDGHANVDSTDFPNTPSDWIPSLVAKGIRVYTVGYTTDSDPTLLKQLAQGTSGKFWDAEQVTLVALRKGFRTALAQWVDLNGVVDPTSTITAGQNKTHAVCIDDAARAIVFVLDWDQNQQDAIAFTLQSPQGLTITAGPNASVYRSNTYTMWVVRGDLVRLGAGAGQWTLNLTGSSQISGTLNYSYSVQVQSFVNTQPKFANAVLATGQVLELTVPLDLLKPDLRKQAKVTLNYRAPQQSFNNWLAKSKVDPAWIVGPDYNLRAAGNTAAPAPLAQSASTGGTPHAPSILRGEPLSLAQKKAWALANIAKTPFPNQFTQGTVELHDNGAGTFTAQGPKLKVEGLYQIDIGVLSQVNANACYQRSFTFRDYVQVALTPRLLVHATEWQSVKPSPFFDAEVTRVLNTPVPPGVVRSMVVTTPRDHLGNYFGAGNGQAIKFQLREAKAIGAPQDLLDGRYAQIVEYSKGAKPQAIVTAGNVTSTGVRQGPRCPFLRWLWHLFGH